MCEEEREWGKISCVCAGGVCDLYTHIQISVFAYVCVAVGLSLRAGSQCCVITWLSATEPHWNRDRSGAVSYTTQRSSPSEPLAQSLFSLGSGHNMESRETQARSKETSKD